MGCVQLASGGDEEGRSASGRPDSCGGEETVEKGGAWRFPCAKTEGEMGVWSTAPRGGRREGGEPGGVGATRGGGGVPTADKTCDRWGRSAVGVVRKQERRSPGAWAVVGRLAWAWPGE
jgi:hypothetical protein